MNNGPGVYEGRKIETTLLRSSPCSPPNTPGLPSIFLLWIETQRPERHSDLGPGSQRQAGDVTVVIQEGLDCILVPTLPLASPLTLLHRDLDCSETKILF